MENQFENSNDKISFESNEIINAIITSFADENPEFQKQSGEPNVSNCVRALIIRGAKHENIWWKLTK